MTDTLVFHPLANIFPLIEGKAFEDLVADVRAHGLLEPIILLDGQILDGRNRYRAATAAGVFDPAHDVQLFDGEDPLAWVLSKNLHRRHLDESQRAALGAKLESLEHGGKRKGKPAQDANLQLDRARVAELVNVSPRSIASAKKVMKEGAPELFNAIEQGTVTASVAEKMLALTPDAQARALATERPKALKTIAKKAHRAERERKLADKQRALPTRLYNVILADPPWRFEPYSRDTGLDRAADNHYPTTELDEIKALPVGTLAAVDSALFLWATAPMLPEALAVMRFWGFTYRSQVIWRKAAPAACGHFDHPGKLVLGTGYWFRNGHEVLLVGTRGAIPAPAMGEQWPSVLDAEPMRHSQKPDRFYELIEAYFPTVDKIELNARAARAGWDRWGLEAPAEEVIIDPMADYLAALAASTVAPGEHNKASAAPILRAAYALDPPLPVDRIVADLGAKKNTVLSWLLRLELTKPGRQRQNGSREAKAARQRMMAQGGGVNDAHPSSGQGGADHV